MDDLILRDDRDKQGQSGDDSPAIVTPSTQTESTTTGDAHGSKEPIKVPNSEIKSRNVPDTIKIGPPDNDD